MFHASRALTAANAARYFEAEYRQGDYYTRDASAAPGQWFGRAAADLGLHGSIRPDDFTALLEGRAPDGTPLVLAQQATGRRRAAWDFTCSADKTVSIAALVFDDSRLIDAHDNAVRRAVAELEPFVQTRAKAGTEVQTTGRIAAALFRHESSRALDPQLHTHVVIANVTRRDDGAWRAIYERDLFRAQRFATAV
jgi:conjugative relaxase-like TrwC/TraI family protein